MYLIFLYSFILLQSVICLFKSFVLFLKTIFSFIIIYTLFLISFKRIHMFKHTVSNLEFFYVLICLYCISIIIFWPGAIVFLNAKWAWLGPTPRPCMFAVPIPPWQKHGHCQFCQSFLLPQLQGHSRTLLPWRNL